MNSQHIMGLNLKNLEFFANHFRYFNESENTLLEFMAANFNLNRVLLVYSL